MNRKEMLIKLEKGEDPLELSIQKWQDIIDGVGKNLDERNCALCEVYDDACRGCPVFLKIGEIGCETTPYEDYCFAKDKTAKKAAAKREVKFLKSLRKNQGKETSS